MTLEFFNSLKILFIFTQHLEQEKHELRRRFENREGEWEGRVSELESGVNQLQLELESQQARKQIEKKHGLSRNYQNRTKGYWTNSAG